jgi:uncharacterized membrane protein
MLEYLNALAISIFHSIALIVAALLLMFLAIVALIYGVVAWNKKMEKAVYQFYEDIVSAIKEIL